MRVLHIQKATGIGGSERHLLTLLPGLAARGVDVAICVLEQGESQRFVDPLTELGVEVVGLRAGPNENPLLVPALGRHIRRFQPDLVHTHLLHADLYGLPAARMVGVPAVRSLHRTVGRRGYRSLERAVGGLASRTIAISQEVGRFVQEARVSPWDRVRVVPYGIDASVFACSAGKRAEAREGFGVGPGDVAVGIASRLVPGKGHGFLIDAVAAAHPRAPAIRLLVAGDGPLRGMLERQARCLAPGVATFTGHVVDVPSFMAACDVLVFPTLPEFGEGFGLAALEAIAAGCPVVATPMGSLPEMVVDGVTGFLVAPGAVDQLAAALVCLAEDPELRRTLGANAAERARTEFGAARMVDATLGIYQEVLSEHRLAGNTAGGLASRRIGRPNRAAGRRVAN